MAVSEAIVSNFIKEKRSCHLLTTDKIEGERGRVLIQGGWDTYLLVAWLSWEETS